MENKPEQQDLRLSRGIIRNLETTRKWATFIAIVGFIFMVILVVFGFFIMPIMTSISGTDPVPGFPSAIFGILYLIFGIIYFFPLFFLFRFARNAKTGIKNNDQPVIESAFRNLKYHYTYIGVLMAIMTGMYVLGGMALALIAIIA